MTSESSALATCQRPQAARPAAPQGRRAGHSSTSQPHNNHTQQHTHTQDTGYSDIIYTLLSRTRAKTSQVSQQYIPSSRGVPACDVATAWLWTLEHLFTPKFFVKSTTPTTRLGRVVFVAFYDLHPKNTKTHYITHTCTHTRQINTPHTKDGASQCS